MGPGPRGRAVQRLYTKGEHPREEARSPTYRAQAPLAQRRQGIVDGVALTGSTARPGRSGAVLFVVLFQARSLLARYKTLIFPNGEKPATEACGSNAHHNSWPCVLLGPKARGVGETSKRPGTSRRSEKTDTWTRRSCWAVKASALRMTLRAQRAARIAGGRRAVYRSAEGRAHSACLRRARCARRKGIRVRGQCKPSGRHHKIAMATPLESNAARASVLLQQLPVAVRVAVRLLPAARTEADRGLVEIRPEAVAQANEARRAAEQAHACDKTIEPKWLRSQRGGPRTRRTRARCGGGPSSR